MTKGIKLDKKLRCKGRGRTRAGVKGMRKRYEVRGKESRKGMKSDEREEIKQEEKLSCETLERKRSGVQEVRR